MLRARISARIPDSAGLRRNSGRKIPVFDRETEGELCNENGAIAEDIGTYRCMACVDMRDSRLGG